MPYCPYCGWKTDYDALLCPRCGESQVGEDTGLDAFQIQDEIDTAKHKANIYNILAIVLVTVGIVAGGILCVSLDLIGLFGIVFVCLGVGCAAWAARYERKAMNLKKQLRRYVHFMSLSLSIIYFIEAKNALVQKLLGLLGQDMQQ